MAGFSNIYPNLPGMMVEFKDGGMSLRQDVTVNSSDCDTRNRFMSSITSFRRTAVYNSKGTEGI